MHQEIFSESISCTIDEILKLDFPTYSTDGDTIKSGSKIFKCEECDAVFKTKSGLLGHTKSKHEGIVYSCNQCNYKATQQGHLKAHKQSKH